MFFKTRPSNLAYKFNKTSRLERYVIASSLPANFGYKTKLDSTTTPQVCTNIAKKKQSTLKDPIVNSN